jgi:hypothetical protein
VTAAAEAPVGPVAGTKEYSREYQRRELGACRPRASRRYSATASTRTTSPTSRPRCAGQAEYLLAAGHPTSLIMAETGLTYRNVYELRDNLR